MCVQVHGTVHGSAELRRADNMTAVADCMHHMQPKIHFSKSHFDTNGNILLHSGLHNQT